MITQFSSIAALILVGLLWGATNPLIRRGAIKVQQRQQHTRFSRISWLNSILLHLSTPAFIVPQLLNLSGGVLFALALPRAPLAVAVPVANGISIAANAIVDRFCGEGIPLWPGIPGIALIVLGVSLCSA